MNRNLKVVLIVGVAILLFGGGIFYFVMSLLKSSGAYEMAMETLRNNSRAIELLGEPIEDGMFPMGSVETSGSSGYADLSISVSGPKASGKLYVLANKWMEDWRAEHLVLEVGGEQVDLLVGGE